jgi:hypothetical protein
MYRSFRLRVNEKLLGQLQGGQMKTVNYDKLTPLGIGFVTHTFRLTSRIIRYTQRMRAGEGFVKAWKSWLTPDIPSHVFLNFPIEDKTFAAEMRIDGLNLDTSIRREYLENKYQKVFGWHFYNVFADAGNQQKALISLTDLRDQVVKYGWEEIGRQAGINFKDKAGTLICSALVNYIYRDFSIDFGKDANPYDIWKHKPDSAYLL